MRYRVRLITASGTEVLWHKGGRVHTLDERLGPVWAQNFKPEIFQLSAGGELVPRGTPEAVNIVGWELEPES